jgi:hypothetical protein
LGIPPNRVFLVSAVAEKQFKRFGTMDFEVMSFRVIKDKLYISNHYIESEDGSLTIIDLASEKTSYIYQLKVEEELKPLETWAPFIGINAKGEVVVQLNEDENKLYRIENDYLVFAQAGSIEQFENSNLPLR